MIQKFSSVVTRTPIDVWSLMLRRHLGIPVFDDTVPLKRAQCHTPMDHLGDHATDLCSKGIGWKNRHDALVEVLGTHVFKAAGVGVDYEVKHLLPGLNARPADILVHPPSTPSDSVPPLPVAFDVNVSSLFQISLLHTAARRPQVVANAAERRKTRAFAAKVAAIPGDAPPGQSNLR